MKSALPKVMHRILGRTLLGHVLAASAALGADSTVVVVGHGRDAVIESLVESDPQVITAVQEQQRGTAHAVRTALAELDRRSRPSTTRGGPVVVLAGDAPLITSATLIELLAAHDRSGAAATVLSARLPDPTGYGRVVRGPDGAVLAIVEQKDTDAASRAIDEVSSGVFAFAPDLLRAAVARVGTANAAGEEYLPDVLGLLRADGHVVGAVAAASPAEVLGVNDRVQLAQAGALLRDRINEQWMRHGVTMLDPATTWVEVGVTLDADCVIHQNTELSGRTHVARLAEVGPDSTLRDVEVGEGARVRRSEATEADIGPRAQVGPFSYLRPGTVLAANSKVGAFVETKNAVVGEGSKVPHLSYVGDAEIGVGTNIGAATVFVNYDGVHKHRTVVGDHVRIGSDSMLVAPLTVGDGAYTAAGSVVTEDVPPGALAVARGRQRNVARWVHERRAGSASAQAAALADSENSGVEPGAGPPPRGEQPE
jgi:bifunctional UDP-N-acetylglucosamine pyrophosphorylase/glucosamine-1-phosphate N-acetyltransferase